MPSSIWLVGILVALESRSVRTVSCVGSRCCTNTNAMPVSSGSARRSWVKASRPPAEAPIPTTGKRGADATSCPRCCLPRGDPPRVDARAVVLRAATLGVRSPDAGARDILAERTTHARDVRVGQCVDGESCPRQES